MYQLGPAHAEPGFSFAYEEVINVKSDRNSNSPFDPSAINRLCRMGLADADGSIDRDAMAVFCNIFAGQFYDDLCDYHQDDSTAVKAVLTSLVDEMDTGDPHGKFLMICLQYDSIYCALPDPVWWLSGSPILAEAFADGFLLHLKRLNEMT